MKQPQFYCLMLEKNQRLLTKDDFDTTHFIHTNADGTAIFWTIEQLNDAIIIYNRTYLRLNIKPDNLVAVGYNGSPENKIFADFVVKI